MAITTIQSGRLADAENPSLSSLDSEPRSSFESQAHEKTGDEEALVSPNRQSQEEEDEHSSSGSRTKLLLWMLANTLATVGIVRTRTVSFNSKISESPPNQPPHPRSLPTKRSSLLPFSNTPRSVSHRTTSS